jgi:hypothetical protein
MSGVAFRSLLHRIPRIQSKVLDAVVVRAGS